MEVNDLFSRGRKKSDVVPPDAVGWVAPTWEELVRDYSGLVYRYAYRLTGNQFDAEDLTQEVFIKVFKSIHRFQPGTLEGWLRRITTNLFLDSARRRQRIRFDPMADQSERVETSEPNPSQVIDDAGLDHDVAAALAQLAPEYRVAVVLCDIEGHTYDEIAELLDIKVGTVRSRISRGRAQLRASLAHRRPTGDRTRYLGVPAEGRQRAATGCGVGAADGNRVRMVIP